MTHVKLPLLSRSRYIDDWRLMLTDGCSNFFKVKIQFINKNYPSRSSTFRLLYLFPVQICYLTGYIKAFITTSFLYFQLFHADEKLIFVLRASRLGLISSMRLDYKKGIRSVKSTWSILHSELKAHSAPPLERNNKHTHMHTICGDKLSSEFTEYWIFHMKSYLSRFLINLKLWLCTMYS